jgi:hypothetical protein
MHCYFLVSSLDDLGATSLVFRGRSYTIPAFAGLIVPLTQLAGAASEVNSAGQPIPRRGRLSRGTGGSPFWDSSLRKNLNEDARN